MGVIKKIVIDGKEIEIDNTITIDSVKQELIPFSIKLNNGRIITLYATKEDLEEFGSLLKAVE